MPGITRRERDCKRRVDDPQTAKPARIHELFQRQGRRLEIFPVGGHQLHTIFAAGVDDLLAFADGDSKRLLAKDVFARLGGAHGELHVRTVGSGDVHGFDFGVAQARVECAVSIRAARAELRGEGFRFFRVAAHERSQLRAPGVSKARQNSALRDVPQADDRVPHPFCIRHERFPSDCLGLGVQRAPHSVVGRTDCGQAPKGCKGGSRFRREFLNGEAEGVRPVRNTVCNPPTTYCIFSLDTTRLPAQNPRNFFRGFPVQGTGWVTASGKNRASFQRGESVQYLPGWTVQCINPECAARGHWLRATDSGGELCSNCSAPLHNVPPPISPRLRMRPRSLGSYRPPGRSPGRQR